MKGSNKKTITVLLILIILLLLLVALLLLGIVMKKNHKDTDAQKNKTTAEKIESTVVDDAEAQTDEKEQKDSEKNATSKEASSKENDNKTVGAQDLSANEISEINEMLNSHTYYGFCLSEYDNASDIDWNQVFYTGAGIAENNVTPEQRQAYMRAENLDEIYTDITCISGKNIEEFMRLHAGYGIVDAKHMNFTYVMEYDLYVHMHGDTNYITSEALYGQKDGNEYTVIYNGHDEQFQPARMEIKFVKEGDNYRFISNRKLGDSSVG